MSTKPIYQDKPLFPKLLWQRPVHYYKAAAGKVLVLAGSKGMTGAAMLTCEAIFRSGTGILLLGFPESLKTFYKGILADAMMLELPETPSHSLAKRGLETIVDNANSCDVVIIGPGLSSNAETIQLVWEIVFGLDKTIVLDADGLIALTKGIEVLQTRENEAYVIDYFKNKRCELVLTLYSSEAAKIAAALKLDSKYTSSYIDKHKNEIAVVLAEKLTSTVVLKGQDCTIATSEGNLIINRSEDSQVATTGTQDILSGVIGSFIGQNPTKILEATATGAYLHELSVSISKGNIQDRSVTTADIIRYLPEAIKKAENE